MATRRKSPGSGSAPDSRPRLFNLFEPLPLSGKTFGQIAIPHSRDDSAQGLIFVPIVVIANGDGPTALMIAGSQGDEFEGQVALTRLAQTLDIRNVRGRIILLPVANQPAAAAGTRHSPIDGLSLNRSYPGDPRGRPTAIIADYIERNLMSQTDIVIDLHSGGHSLRYLPCATIVEHQDADQRARRLAAAFAFGAPMVLIMHAAEERNSSGAARRAGAIRIGADIGGGGAVQKELAELTYSCVCNVLRWTGILQDSSLLPAPNSDCFVGEVELERDYLFSDRGGVFEPCVNLGDDISAGQVTGLLYDPMNPAMAPQEIVANWSGRVIGLRALGLTRPGDCLVQCAHPARERFKKEFETARASTWLKDAFGKRRPKSRPVNSDENKKVP